MTQLKISCQGAATLHLSDLTPLQGALKDLSEENYKKLKKELLELGFSEPISVWKHDGKNYLLNGHQRHRALTQMQNEGVLVPPLPVNWVEAKDVKEAKKKILSLTSQFGEITGQGLYEFAIHADLTPEEIRESFRFPEINPDSWELEFFKDNEVPHGDPDEVPEHVEPRTKLGDIYQLGDHRLMCGDSTSIDAVEALMAGKKADMVFTDPPYNQSKSGGGFNETRSGWSEHKSDHLNDFQPEEIFPLFEASQAQSGYFFCNKGLLASYITWAQSVGGWDLLVMGKNNPIPTKHQKFLSDIEYIVFIRKPGAYFNDSLEYDYYRKVRMVSVHAREFGHPTEKQVQIIEPFLEISCPPGGAVLDLFGGSGSTLIASEKNQRRCFMMELSPKYCDVIVARWEKYTGRKAELLTAEKQHGESL